MAITAVIFVEFRENFCDLYCLPVSFLVDDIAIPVLSPIFLAKLKDGLSFLKWFPFVLSKRHSLSIE